MSEVNTPPTVKPPEIKPLPGQNLNLGPQPAEPRPIEIRPIPGVNLPNAAETQQSQAVTQEAVRPFVQSPESASPPANSPTATQEMPAVQTERPNLIQSVPPEAANQSSLPVENKYISDFAKGAEAGLAPVRPQLNEAARNQLDQARVTMQAQAAATNEAAAYDPLKASAEMAKAQQEKPQGGVGGFFRKIFTGK